MLRLSLTLITVCTLLALAGCAPDVTVTVTPDHKTINPGETLFLNATVSNTKRAGVTWHVREADGGVVHQGAYTAPRKAGTFHIVATSTANPRRTAEAAVTVAPVAVMVEPVMITVPLNTKKSVRFTATTIDDTGEHPVAVTWRVKEKQGGAMTREGIYTPPAAVGTYHLIATTPAGASAVAMVMVMQ